MAYVHTHHTQYVFGNFLRSYMLLLQLPHINVYIKRWANLSTIDALVLVFPSPILCYSAFLALH